MEFISPESLLSYPQSQQKSAQKIRPCIFKQYKTTGWHIVPPPGPDGVNRLKALRPLVGLSGHLRSLSAYFFSEYRINYYRPDGSISTGKALTRYILISFIFCFKTLKVKLGYLNSTIHFNGINGIPNVFDDIVRVGI